MAESKLSKLYDWLDERTGIKEIMREALDEPIRGGARWAYVFGSVLLFLFGIQVVTGIFLSLYYAPTADHAHASVSYIQKAVTGGALLRGLH
ncbi:MAG TPA: cytochrome bc complex cytochrome b subunit, partial [Blastocatellia bacterium]